MSNSKFILMQSSPNRYYMTINIPSKFIADWPCIIEALHNSHAPCLKHQILFLINSGYINDEWICLWPIGATYI